jgi:hypothetical protein
MKKYFIMLYQDAFSYVIYLFQTSTVSKLQKPQYIQIKCCSIKFAKKNSNLQKNLARAHGKDISGPNIKITIVLFIYVSNINMINDN